MTILISNLFELALTVKSSARTLLQHFHDNHIDWLHACGGKGRCTTCKLSVVQGAENFMPPTEAELKYRQSGELGINERLACQAKIEGDVRIQVPSECKLPHVRYSDDQ